MRYPGQSILIYPKHRTKGITARDLFAEPIEIIVDSVGQRDDVHTRIVADKRLVVVRDEIYRRNGNSYTPAPALREEAYRRAFVEIARMMLNKDLFTSLSQQAWLRAMEPTRVELTD
jgi:hypothetical protein